MTIEIIEEVMPGTSIVEEIVNLQLSVIEGDTAAAEAAAAAAAASAASASSSASTATTQAGIATTKAQEADASATAAETARTGAETAETNAETAQAAAEAARDEITDKVDFTDIQVGDLLQAVDVSGVVKLVRVTPVELLKSTGPFLKSPLAGTVDLDNVFAWDGFSRQDGPIGVSDSGHVWTTLPTTVPFKIENKTIQGTGLTTDFKSAVIDRVTIPTTSPNRGGIGVFCNFFYRANAFRIIIAKDLNNYFSAVITINAIAFIKVISGSQTIILNQSISRDTESNGTIDVRLDRNTGNSRLYLSAFDYNAGNTYRVDLSSDFAIYDLNDWRFVGFLITNTGIAQSASIKNVLMYNL